MNKLVLLLILIASLVILLPVLLIEGAACGEGEKCGIWPTRTPVPPTPPAQVTPTPNEHWIDPEPWPVDPYPAPEDTPDSYPAPYPEPENTPAAYPQPKKPQPEAPSLATSLWAWVLDLFTN